MGAADEDEWTVDLSGSPAIVPLARQWVRKVLRDLPALVEDMQLIASELTTNCVRHSVAAEGETVRLRLIRRGERLRLEVIDAGPRVGTERGWTEEEAGNFGRGLLIISVIADKMGDETIVGGGRLAWAELRM